MSGQSLADRSYGTSAEAVAWHQACGIVAVSHKLVGLVACAAWHVGSPVIEADAVAGNVLVDVDSGSRQEYAVVVRRRNEISVYAVLCGPCPCAILHQLSILLKGRCGPVFAQLVRCHVIA